MAVPSRDACLQNAAAAANNGQRVAEGARGNPAWVSAYAALGGLWLELRAAQDPDALLNPEDEATWSPGTDWLRD